MILFQQWWYKLYWSLLKYKPDQWKYMEIYGKTMKAKNFWCPPCCITMIIISHCDTCASSVFQPKQIETASYQYLTNLALMYICTLGKCMPTNFFKKHINRGLKPVIHTHFRLTIPMKCSKQRLCEEILQSLWRLELSQKVSLIRGGSRWNVPTRGALNNFSIRWKFLNFEQFQKIAQFLNDCSLL